MASKSIFDINLDSLGEIFHKITAGLEESELKISSETQDNVYSISLLIAIIIALLFPFSLIIGIVISFFTKYSISIVRPTKEQ